MPSVERYSSLREKLLDRYVEINGPLHSKCWMWTGNLWSNGYGRLWWNRDPLSAHRVSWIVHNGPIPDDLWVCHRCDNKPCINPDHLFLGTCQDNTDDKMAKGRHKVAIGVNQHNAILNDQKVAEIRWLLANTGWSHPLIAERYDVSRENIWRISSGHHWKHVTETIKPEWYGKPTIQRRWL